MTPESAPSQGYEAPQLVVLGTVAELTQASCGKRLGGSDFFIFRGTQLVCSSG
jgi:hypothetical protein